MSNANTPHSVTAIWWEVSNDGALDSSAKNLLRAIVHGMIQDRTNPCGAIPGWGALRTKTITKLRFELMKLSDQGFPVDLGYESQV